jgi:malate dehydrogenase (oxaloacetate-decarboxylating)
MIPGDPAPPTSLGAVVWSFLVEVAHEPDYDAAASALAGHGVAVKPAPMAPGRWGLEASCASEEAMPAAEEVLLRYFKADLLCRVGRVTSRIAVDPEAVDAHTGRRNTIAMVTDGSAVLGVGAVGPLAALPVIEGKAALFARLADINAIPLCLATTDVDEIVATVAALSPTFGGIDLEDIAAPRCFAVEAGLQERLAVPVLHGDYHGTAVVVLAALRGALRLVGKRLETARIVISGAGAAGTAVARFLLGAGASDVVVESRHGILHPGDTSLLPAHKRWLAAHTNPRGVRGRLPHALAGADVFVAVSGRGVLSRALVATMALDPVVFALADPVNEVDPGELAGTGAVVATGRSDYPNQINNVVALPGIFRGVLDAGASRITEAMKLAAADALTELMAPRLSRHCLLPDPFDPAVVPAVAAAVIDASRPAKPTDVPSPPPVCQ